MQRRLAGLADHYLSEYLSKIERATEPLDQNQLWWRPNQRSNSIANLLLHLRGNLAQWILGGLCGESVTRRRGAEFAAREADDGRRLVADLSATIGRCRAGIRQLSAEQLSAERTIQGYTVDGYAALFHAIEHASYHTGQIVLLAKMMLPAESRLEFYPQHRDE